MTFEVTSATYVEAVASAQIVDVALPFSYPLAVASVSYLDAVVSYAQYLDVVVVMGHLVYAAEPEPTDTTAPTLAITSGAASTYQGATTSLTFTFSEDVEATFAQADVVVSAGTVSLLLRGTGVDGSTVFTDEAGNSVAGVGGAINSTTRSKFGGSSLYFNGSGSYLRTINTSEADFAGSFSIECWVYVDAYTYPWGTILSRLYDPGTSGYRVIVSAGGWIFNFFGTDYALHTVSGGDVPLAGWAHLAVTFDGTKYRTFTNGVMDSELIAPSIRAVGSSMTQLVGSTNESLWYYQGHIDDLRITQGAALYVANFTPPTAALNLIATGTLSNFAGSGANYSATFTGTSVGTANISVASGAYADAAGNLGAASSLSISVIPALEVFPFFSIGSTQPYSALSSLMSMGSDPVTMEYKTVPFTIRFGEN